ncbi:MAG TPA: hypothetical protein VGF95_09495 [Solirubrobacteraceae bacterium]
MAAIGRSLRAFETWLWTGPLGHLAGGAADFAAALAHYGIARRKDASRR